jgi:hypothetical protein
MIITFGIDEIFDFLIMCCVGACLLFATVATQYWIRYLYRKE